MKVIQFLVLSLFVVPVITNTMDNGRRNEGKEEVGNSQMTKEQKALYERLEQMMIASRRQQADLEEMMAAFHRQQAPQAPASSSPAQPAQEFKPAPQPQQPASYDFSLAGVIGWVINVGTEVMTNGQEFSAKFSEKTKLGAKVITAGYEAASLAAQGSDIGKGLRKAKKALDQAQNGIEVSSDSDSDSDSSSSDDEQTKKAKELKKKTRKTE